MSERLVEAQNLRKVYAGGVVALDGVGFAVHAGEIYGLLGPNGAGKTTTVRILATLTAPSSGRALVAGFNVASDARRVRLVIGYVGQGTGVDRHLTGRENLWVQGRLRGMGGRRLQRRIDELLELVDLKDAADRLTQEWSGGMRRRLDVALGLLHHPRVLFLDEPTVGLDPESRAVLHDRLQRLAREEQVAVLLTTHYLEEADRLSDRIGIIDHGRIVAEDTPAALKAGIRGDVVVLAFRSDAAADDAARRLRSFAGLREMGVHADRIFATVEDGAAMVPKLVTALPEGSLARVELRKPTLDEVYLALTGRTMAEADRQAAAQGQEQPA